MARTATKPADPRPVVTQVDAGGDDTVVLDGTRLDLGDDAQLYAQLVHKPGCPMVDAPLDGDDTTPGRRQRMEHYDVQLPRTEAHPQGGVCIMVRCADCANQVRID